MIDREKVIRHINAEIEIAKICKKDFAQVDIDMLSDALALLKEQEGVKPEWKGGVPFCGNCGHRLQKKNRNMVGINCPMCKRSVKWE